MQEKMGVSKEVNHNHPEGANAVDATWVFKIKNFPDEVQGLLLCLW
jgi:hypothetical protein